MKKKEIKKEFDLKNFKLPKYDEIPDVGLYLDQVVKYINSYFGDYEDMYITPSMLTNYVKQKIVEKVSKKTYSRDQIAHFIYIAVTKSVMSLNNISTSFKLNEDEFNKYYDDFIEILLEFLEHGISEYNNQKMHHQIAATVANKMKLDIYFNNLD